MKLVRKVALVLVFGLALVGLVALGLAATEVNAFQQMKASKTELHRKASQNLADALAAMDEASKALAGGEKDKASAALDKATGLIKETRTSMITYAPGAKAP